MRFRESCQEGVHKFEPRYSLYMPQGSELVYGKDTGFDRIIERQASKIYVYDICVRCGKTVKKAIQP